SGAKACSTYSSSPLLNIRSKRGKGSPRQPDGAATLPARMSAALPTKGHRFSGTYREECLNRTGIRECPQTCAAEPAVAEHRESPGNRELFRSVRATRARGSHPGG